MTSSIPADELHVASSPTIPFPAPAPVTPLRSKRTAARVAVSAMSEASQKQKMFAADGSDAEMATEGEEEEPDLTNDDTAESWTAGEGETDEAVYQDDDEADVSLGEPTEDEEPIAPAPRKRRTPAKRKIKTSASVSGIAKTAEENDKNMESSKRLKTVRGKVKKIAAGIIAKQFEEGDNLEAGHASDSSALTPAEDLEEKPKKQRKPRKPRPPKPEPVYEIPEIEKLPNSGYQGRLGYACLNTILRKKKPPVFCSRTCR